jgi:hypothetical protein
LSSLKKRYDTRQSGTFNKIKETIVKNTEIAIDKGDRLPFYNSGLDLSGISFTYLYDILKQDYGIVISSYPNGIVVEDLVEIDEEDDGF